jgi:hypothetical protein
VPHLLTQSLSTVKPVPVPWLWEPILARGKLAILDGDPGAGKTAFLVDLAARLSRGGPLPDGRMLDRPHVTLFLTPNDNEADTIRPRADAAGADPDRIVFAYPSSLDDLRFPDHIRGLQEVTAGEKADLLVIDPLAQFAPTAAGGETSVREVVTQLAWLAARTRAAVLAVRRLNKIGRISSLYRGTGSIGVIGASRLGLLVARHPDDRDLRVLAQTKSNIGPPAPSLGFRIAADPAGRAAVTWAGPVDVTADELCAAPPVPAGKRPRERAIEWLREELAGGPRKAAELIAAAAEAGIPLRTLERAKKEAGIECEQVEREWVWTISGVVRRRPRPETGTVRRPGDGVQTVF